jgi:hypothetical protein
VHRLVHDPEVGGRRVGLPADVVERGAILGQPRLHLRPHAVDQHQPHAQAVQQVDVVRQLHEAAIRHQFAAKGDDEGLAAKAMDVRRGRAEPVDEIGGVFQRNGLSGLFTRRIQKNSRRHAGQRPTE